MLETHETFPSEIGSSFVLDLRDLYEILLRNEALQTPSQFVHQMERKGGRSPTLRFFLI
jgi:hypothetical protein